MLENFDNTPVDLCISGIADFEVAVPWEGGSVEWTNSQGEVVSCYNYFQTGSPGTYTAIVSHQDQEVCSVSVDVLSLDLSADIDYSGHVGSDDLLEFLSSYGCQTFCLSDINSDGTTTVQDLLELLVQYGQGC